MIDNLVLKLHDEMAGAMQRRSALRYSAEEDFHPEIKAWNPILKRFFTLPKFWWRNEREKREVMARIGVMAYYTKMEALMLVTDTRFVRSEKFADYFKLKHPDGEDIEEFQRQYREILKRYGGEIRNLPREIWSEAVVIAVKGPEIGTLGLMAPYRSSPDDRVIWEPVKEDEGHQMVSYIIPDYWTQEFRDSIELPKEAEEFFKTACEDLFRVQAEAK